MKRITFHDQNSKPTISLSGSIGNLNPSTTTSRSKSKGKISRSRSYNQDPLHEKIKLFGFEDDDNLHANLERIEKGALAAKMNKQIDQVVEVLKQSLENEITSSTILLLKEKVQPIFQAWFDLKKQYPGEDSLVQFDYLAGKISSLLNSQNVISSRLLNETEKTLYKTDINRALKAIRKLKKKLRSRQYELGSDEALVLSHGSFSLDGAESPRNANRTISASEERRFKKDWNCARLYCDRGNEFLKNGNLKMALHWYEAAVKLGPGLQYMDASPSYAVALYNQGLVQEKLGMLRKALASYNLVLGVDPGYKQAECKRDKLRWRIKLEEFGEHINEDADALHERGNVLAQLNRLDEAVESLAKSILLKPNNAGAFFLLGNVLNNLSRYHEAVQSFEEAVKLDPDNEDYITKRDHVYDKLDYLESMGMNENRMTSI